MNDQQVIKFAEGKFDVYDSRRVRVGIVEGGRTTWLATLNDCRRSAYFKTRKAAVAALLEQSRTK